MCYTVGGLFFGKEAAAMTAEQRRQEILTLLEQTDTPLSAAALAHRFSVSRQIVVGDVALLRAQGREIVATARGYVIPAPAGLVRQVACRHTAAQTREELDAMVDCGCTVIDVVVEHPVYGEITAPLQLSSRRDVDEFVRKMLDNAAQPLSLLTDGIHAHRLSVPDEDAFQRVCAALRQKGMLLED